MNSAVAEMPGEAVSLPRSEPPAAPPRPLDDEKRAAAARRRMVSREVERLKAAKDVDELHRLMAERLDRPQPQRKASPTQAPARPSAADWAPIAREFLAQVNRVAKGSRFERPGDAREPVAQALGAVLAYYAPAPDHPLAAFVGAAAACYGLDAAVWAYEVLAPTPPTLAAAQPEAAP